MKAPIDVIVASAARIYAIARPNPEKRLTDAECRVMRALESEYLDSIGAAYLVTDDYGRIVSGTSQWYTIQRANAEHPGGIKAGSREEAVLRVAVWPDRRDVVSVVLDPDSVLYRELKAEWKAREKASARDKKIGSGDLLALLGNWEAA